MEKIRVAIERPDKGQLGLLVWWGSWKASVTPQRLQELAEEYFLPLELLPPVPSPEKAFRRAATRAVADDPDYIVEQTYSDAFEITYGILHKRTDKAGRRAEHTQVAKASWFPPLDSFVSDQPGHKVVEAIRKDLPYYTSHYVTDDIRVLAHNVMRTAYAIRMVGSGGNSRFIPGRAPVVEALAEVLRQVPGCEFELIRVPDDELSRGTMVRAAESSFASQVEETEKEVKRLQEAMEKAQEDSGKGPRESTLQARISELQDISAKVDLFSEVLRFKADTLQERLQGAEKALRGLLGI